MISRRQGGGDEAYYIYVEEADDAANKDSALSWKLNQIPSHLTKLNAAIPPR
jgi:hypothetical protein